LISALILSSTNFIRVKDWRVSTFGLQTSSMTGTPSCTIDSWLRSRLSQNGTQEKQTRLWIDRALRQLGLWRPVELIGPFERKLISDHTDHSDDLHRQ
jgi:hypothetical protein